MQHHKKVPQARLSQGLQPQKPPPQKNAPLFAAVESDTVGYTTIEMQAGKWYQIGNPFVELGDGASLAVNTLFDSGFANGDFLYIYNTETGLYGNMLYWGTSTDGRNGWLDSNGNYATTTLKMGQAVFLKKATSSSVVLKGKVSGKEITVFGADDNPAWAQIICVYPTDMPINEIKWANLKTNDMAYLYNSDTGLYGNMVYWGTTPDGKEGWLDSNGNLSSVVIPVGRALFIYRQSAGQGQCSPAVVQ